jgi:hypothetical protein
MDSYDPEDWSILSHAEQARFRSLVARCSWYDLSIAAIFYQAQVSVTDARYCFVYWLVQQRWFNSRVYQK